MKSKTRKPYPVSLHAQKKFYNTVLTKKTSLKIYKSLKLILLKKMHTKPLDCQTEPRYKLVHFRSKLTHNHIQTSSFNLFDSFAGMSSDVNVELPFCFLFFFSFSFFLLITRIEPTQIMHIKSSYGILTSKRYNVTRMSGELTALDIDVASFAISSFCITNSKIMLSR